MAKRFTDTDKWKREWFYELKPHAKLVWLYLLDQCDHCGIWPRNFKLLSEQTGIKIDHAILVDWFGSKLVHFDSDKYFIPSFFEFQYGSSKEGFKAKQSALVKLQDLGLLDSEGKFKATEHLGNTSEHLPKCPSIGIGNIKSNSKSIIGESEGIFNFEFLYKMYPLRKGKTKGIEKAQKEIKTDEDYANLGRAIQAYAVSVKKSDPKFIKHFSTFMNEWRDWLDPDAGSSLASNKNYENERETDHDKEMKEIWGTGGNA